MNPPGDSIPAGPTRPTSVTVVAILSIVFGVLCSCSALTTLATPMIMEVYARAMSATLERVRAAQAQELEELRVQRDAAEDPAELAQLEQRMRLLQAQELPDFDKLMAALSGPAMKSLSYFQGCAGFVIQILFIVAGIGMLRASRWSRGLCIGAASALIAVSIVATGLNYFVVMPQMMEAIDQFMDQAAALGGGPRVEMPGLMMASSGVGALFGLVVTCVWPTAAIVLLTRPSAKAYFSRRA